MNTARSTDWQAGAHTNYDIRLVAFGMGRNVARSFDPESGESVLAPVVGSDYIELTLEVSDGSLAIQKKLTLTATPDTESIVLTVGKLIRTLADAKEHP